ncbi:hypothetical protein [Mobilicoccus caccae]|uniref:Uncharacterized protein n=1 Tax=Mobilicoccus caccae TaxID=1859295 RepID=A0ABQ6IT25_9MICO|nr:hypothetical protein [Mobilicoccus caccae]GMA41093.1 hypothetical protein GCM10025883_31380 [Mobilicoccus caccae]
MSTSTIHDKLRIALADLTGSVAVIEAAFTPWDDDQRAALEGLLTEMTSSRTSTRRCSKRPPDRPAHASRRSTARVLRCN